MIIIMRYRTIKIIIMRYRTMSRGCTHISQLTTHNNVAMEAFVVTNDTLLSITLLALFLLLSFELLEYFGSKLISPSFQSSDIVHKEISAPLLLPQPQRSLENSEKNLTHELMDVQPEDVDDPVLATMDSGGFVTTALLDEMAKRFPKESPRTWTRFLIARKGSLEAASSMLKASVNWRREHQHSTEDVRNALKAKALFSHSKSKSGTSVIYFRGALYDKSIASTTDYVNAAAHLIDEQFVREVDDNKPSQVCVLIHTAYVEGGVNAPADLGFIKEFVKVLSDNFPERLERLIIYPFPWYGRAVWSVAKTFIDPRTVDKVLLLAQGPGGEYACPPKLAEYVDISEVPTVCGGSSSDEVSYP